MNKSIRFFLIAAGIVAVLGWVCAQATELYTWTDENGVVHYVDTPPDNAKAVSMEAPEAYLPGTSDAYPEDSTPEAGDGNQPQAGQGDAAQNGSASYADQVREQMAQKRKEHKKEQADRDQKCASARLQLATLEPTRRVFFTNDQGETERMDDVERVRKVEEAKAQIAKYCK